MQLHPAVPTSRESDRQLTMMTHEESASYILGHSTEEHRRLMLQSRFIGELTETVVAQAGLTAGMKVIDVGCGAGDVSLLAAALVGPSGSALGIDRSPDALALARQRAENAGFRNITFEVDDIEDLNQSGPFDALVGRLILMYLRDPASVLRKLARLVRPGGIIVFQEMEIAASRAVPDIPLYVTCRR